VQFTAIDAAQSSSSKIINFKYGNDVIAGVWGGETLSSSRVTSMYKINDPTNINSASSPSTQLKLQSQLKSSGVILENTKHLLDNIFTTVFRNYS
jgi:hypothetical protein